MRILIAIDKFKGSIPATEAAQAIASALNETLPEAVCDLCPVADGGEGTAEAVVTALNGEWCETATFDAQNRPVTARYGLVPTADQLEAIMEMSAASGLAMVSDLPLNPAKASTHGTGLMLQDAMERGVPIIGLRTATHAFDYDKFQNEQFSEWAWRGRNKEFAGGFGRQILGETWVDHYGGYRSQSTLGIIPPDKKEHPILRGIGHLWGPGHAYAITTLSGDSQPLVLGRRQPPVRRQQPRRRHAALLPIACLISARLA